MISPGLFCAAATLTAALAASPAASAHDAEGTGAGFVLDEVATGVFVHRGRDLPLDAPGHDDIANIGFIVGGRCVAVIDTGGSVRIGRALREAIRRTTARPICYVINTHVHVDHVLGNVAFRTDRVQFVGHAQLPAEMLRNRSFFLSQYAADFDAPATADQVVPPDLTVADMRSLDLGDRPLQLRAWPTAHTDCDLTVLDQKTGTLWTGDLLFRGRLPALDGDAAGWLQVIDRLAQLAVTRVVPGHGPVTSDLRGSLAEESRYLQTLLSDVRSEIDAGDSLQQAIDTAAKSEQAHWSLWESTHPRNVTRVYQKLEWQ